MRLGGDIMGIIFLGEGGIACRGRLISLAEEGCPFLKVPFPVTKPTSYWGLPPHFATS